MRFFLLCLLIIISLPLATSGAIARSKSRPPASQPNAATADDSNTMPEQQNSAASNSKDSADVDKSLDRLISEPIPSATTPTPKLSGKAEASELESSASTDDSQSNSNNAEPLKPMQPKLAPASTSLLKGSAVASGGKGGAKEDPDGNDAELLIEWDRWRNRFLRAVQLQIQVSLNHPEFEEDARPRIDLRSGRLLPHFPLGTTAWFFCEITSDRQIKHLEITQSSGYPAYDQALIEGVRALEGSSLLRYPQGSHRTLVSQEAGVRTAAVADYQYKHFGDIERYHMPPP